MTRLVVDGSKQLGSFMLAMSRDFAFLSFRKPVALQSQIEAFTILVNILF
ncbi:hypothetical protein [Paenibacillus xylanilyticus]